MDPRIIIPRDKVAVRLKVYCGSIIEQNGKILLVKEAKAKYPGWDFPGGKLLWGELIIDAVSREVYEESGYKVKLTKLLGIYQRDPEPDEDDYLRFIFIGNYTNKKPVKPKDPLIEEVSWFDPKDIKKNVVKVRSPEIYREIEDYLEGKCYPLDCLSIYKW